MVLPETDSKVLLVHDAAVHWGTWSSSVWTWIGRNRRRVHWGDRNVTVRSELMRGFLFDTGASPSFIGIDTLIQLRGNVVWLNNQDIQFLCHTDRKLSGIDGVINRSLACFSPPEVTPRLSLPHASGFSIQSAQGHWDGVDGSPLGRGAALTRRRFDVGTKARWLQEHPQGVLFLPPDCRSLPPSGAPRPAAALIRGIQDPMRWGSVSSRVWTPLPEGVPKTEQLDSSAPPFLLSRWAAEVRGLDVTEDSS